MVGRAKYDAWAKLEGKSAEDAMQEYVDLIESLK
jgi:acyl-CoA-binding protein